MDELAEKSVDELIEKVRDGDAAALGEVFSRYRDRLRRMVKLRMDRRLQGRVDPSDVLQEAYLDVADRAAEYAAKEEMPFFVWLRLVTGERLLQIHRRHLQAQRRNASIEVSMFGGGVPAADSASLAGQLLGNFTTASAAVQRGELKVQIEQALNAMDPMDKEILALRHFEEMSNGEAAAVLQLSKQAASKRYVRALTRFKAELSKCPGLFDDDTRTGP